MWQAQAKIFMSLMTTIVARKVEGQHGNGMGNRDARVKREEGKRRARR